MNTKKPRKKPTNQLEPDVIIPDDDTNIVPKKVKVDTSKLSDEELDAPLVKPNDVVLAFTGKVIKNPVKAIREKCLDCCCWQEREVKYCTVTNCALFPFRMNKNPYRSLDISDDERQKRSERMKNVTIKRDKNKSK